MSNTARTLIAAIVMTVGLAAAATASAHSAPRIMVRPLVVHPHSWPGINRHEAVRIRYQVHEHHRMQRRAAADGRVSRREHAVLARDAAQVRDLIQAASSN